MLVTLDAPPLCLKTNSDGSLLIVGCVDGTIRFYNTDVAPDAEEFEELWRFQTKSSIRGVEIDESRNRAYAITKNRALCVFDLDTGRRLRCLLKCHQSIPSAICTLPPTALKSQQLATADESGQVKTWNFDGDTHPMVREWKEQEEEINQLCVDVKTNLLATCSDGTLAAFDLRKAKFKVRSELMHSELFAVCGTTRSVYVGGEDGYVEVFNINEYGNLLERIESGFEMGVNGIVELRNGLLGLTSGGSNKIRLLNVMPSKRLGIAGCHGDEKDNDDGIDAITISSDKSTVYTMISMNQTIKKWDMASIVNEIPVLRAQDAKSKKKRKMEGFFDGMMEKGDQDSDDSDNDDISDSDIDNDSDISDNEEPKKKRRRQDSDSDDDEENDDEEEEEERTTDKQDSDDDEENDDEEMEGEEEEGVEDSDDDEENDDEEEEEDSD